MVGKASTVLIDERFLEGFALAPGAVRERVFDSRLSGFGVVVGRRRTSFIVRHRVGGKQRDVVLGWWAPSRLRSLDAGVRAATTTVAVARGKAIEELGKMRAGVDPSAVGAGREGGPT